MKNYEDKNEIFHIYVVVDQLNEDPDSNIFFSSYFMAVLLFMEMEGTMMWVWMRIWMLLRIYDDDKDTKVGELSVFPDMKLMEMMMMRQRRCQVQFG